MFFRATDRRDSKFAAANNVEQGQEECFTSIEFIDVRNENNSHFPSDVSSNESNSYLETYMGPSYKRLKKEADDTSDVPSTSRSLESKFLETQPIFVGDEVKVKKRLGKQSNEVGNEMGEFKCQICLNIFPNKTKLHLHSCCTCPLCKATVKNYKNLLMHLLGHRNMILLSCNQCNYSIDSKSKFEKHVTVHKNNENPYWCKFCDISWPKYQSLLSHIIHVHNCKGTKLEHAEELWQNVTPSLTNDSSQLDEIHSLNCQICSETFNDGDELLDHMMLHYTDLSSDDGSDDTEGKNSLKDAKNIDTPLQKREVVSSSADDSTTESYKKVRKTHWKLSNKCRFCGKRFRNKIQLLSHPCSSCPMCGKSDFKQYRTLLIHMMTHKRMMRYECKVCKYSSSNRHKFDKHSELHDDLQLHYWCKICDLSYGTYTTLISHVVIVHDCKGTKLEIQA